MIHVHQEIIKVYERYSRVHQAQAPMMIKGVVREWADMTARQWVANPSLIPRLRILPENVTTSLRILPDVEKRYKWTIARFKEKEIADLDEGALTSYLCMEHIRKHNIVRMNECYDVTTKPKMGMKYSVRPIKDFRKATNDDVAFINPKNTLYRCSSPYVRHVAPLSSPKERRNTVTANAIMPHGERPIQRSGVSMPGRITRKIGKRGMRERRNTEQE